MRLYAASIDRWLFPPALAHALNLVAIAGTPLLALLFFVDRDTFGFILDEDYVVEWGQVALYIATGVAGAWVAADRFRRGYRGQGIVWVLFVLGMVFIAGEEISWGQRLLGFETPELLEEINRQNEITLHNIGRTLTVFNLALFFASLYAIAADWINQRWKLAARWPDGERLYVPPFFLAGLFGVMVAYRFVRSILLNQDSYALTSLSEWAELCFAAALFISVFLSARWLAGRVANGAASAD
ncbi:MAG TPA: hypothetical protein VFN76_08330 [Candidatus Limnocylindria bacterium]|nr:hypothetical protein [Candidatus Limnocylindria bacterium]